jgi:hypothetical protein
MRMVSVCQICSFSHFVILQSYKFEVRQITFENVKNQLGYCERISGILKHCEFAALNNNLLSMWNKCR